MQRIMGNFRYVIVWIAFEDVDEVGAGCENEVTVVFLVAFGRKFSGKVREESPVSEAHA